jgi:pimeloyl-ACP methyl ester carboxylesterase
MTKYDFKFAGADGLGIVAMARGPADGPPVLLAHGGGQTHWAWRRTVETLATRGFRAIAIDLRGHGDSDWCPEGNYQQAAFAADILAIADQIGAKPALVGASLGGIAGIIAEGELRPGSFSSLTLVDITAKPDEGGVARITAFMTANVDNGFASLEEAAAAISAYTSNRAARSASDSLGRYVRLSDDGRYRWHWDPRFLDLVKGPRTVEHARLATALQRLRLPVHLVRGGSSDLVTPEAVDEFRQQVPHASFTDIAGAGHMVVGDRNDTFGNAIISFLETHRMA